MLKKIILKKIENPTPLNVLKPLVLRAYNLLTLLRKLELLKIKR